MTEREIIASHLITDSLLFTKYFFKERFNRSFVTNHHHVEICDLLDRVISGDIKKLAIRIAPRYGKTELAVKNFIAQGLAINPSSKFIHLSYSQQLALDNSEEIRDFIQDQEYQRLFPGVRLSKSSTAKNKWHTTEGGGVYATATGGQITGFGAGEVEEEIEDSEFPIKSNSFAGAIVIDDPLKPDDALSDVKRERVNQRFENTIRSRTNSRNTPIIVIGQALHERDLIGYLMKNEPDEWTLINFPAIQTNENGDEVALWEFKHSLEELLKLRRSDKRVFEIQYQQNPTSDESRLLPLSSLRLVNPETVKPEFVEYSFAVGDPANQGGDNYAMLFVKVMMVENQLQLFVADVIYSGIGIEALSDPIVERLRDNSIEDAFLELNGVGLAAFLMLKTKISNHTTVKGFTTTENKVVKILSNYEFIQKYFAFRSDYKEHTQYAKFMEHLSEYLKDGDNKHRIDAIDVSSMAAKVAKAKYKALLYG